jgi:hypothetical protein
VYRKEEEFAFGSCFIPYVYQHPNQMFTRNCLTRSLFRLQEYYWFPINATSFTVRVQDFHTTSFTPTLIHSTRPPLSNHCPSIVIQTTNSAIQGKIFYKNNNNSNTTHQQTRRTMTTDAEATRIAEAIQLLKDTPYFYNASDSLLQALALKRK